jgi:hypothetical protein
MILSGISATQGDVDQKIGKVELHHDIQDGQMATRAELFISTKATAASCGIILSRARILMSQLPC